jgi:purine-binding chemotaxis protein CheW
MQRELITFEVGGQVFGLDIMAIREIRAWTPATRLPRVPHYVAGVVNLRGTVLPVIDLAARLGWEPPSRPPPCDHRDPAGARPAG